MQASTPRRTALFVDEPIAELRGLAALTDPDDEVAAVIDLAVMGARGDGKTQFLVHAIRALHGRAPALTGSEQELNLAMLRLVLDPRAPRAAAARGEPRAAVLVRAGADLQSDRARHVRRGQPVRAAACAVADVRVDRSRCVARARRDQSLLRGRSDQ